MPSGVETIATRAVQLRGSALARRVLRWAGWQLLFDGLPSRQGVLIVYPHTSNWDFPWAMFAKWSMGWPVSFWCKDSLFRVPVFGRWLRWLGGVPVERDARGGAVGAMIERMRYAVRTDEFFWLGVAPEGTRQRTDGWRSGFYHVAQQAGVPLALAFIDYRARRIGVEAFVRLGGDPGVDMAGIAAHLAHAVGMRAEGAAPIRLLD